MFAPALHPTHPAHTDGWAHRARAATRHLSAQCIVLVHAIGDDPDAGFWMGVASALSNMGRAVAPFLAGALWDLTLDQWRKSTWMVFMVAIGIEMFLSFYLPTPER